MAEYIEREAANNVLRECVRAYPDSFYNGIEVARTAIRKIPAANVRENVTGEWIKGIHMVECSACSEKIDFGYETWVEDYDIVTDIGWNFCPNCGAKMREAKEKI